MDSKILPTNSIRLFYLSIFILLFGGANVLHFIGWNIDYYAAPTYQKLRPEFYILFIVFISRLKNIKFSLTEINILIFTFFVFLYWLVIGQTNGFAVLINTICIPAIISLLLKYTNYKQRRFIAYIVLSFFIINSSLALYERIFNVQIFQYYSGGESILYEYEYNEFRSTALRNHPLGNSLLTSVIMSFILISNQIKVKYKFILFILGFLAIMSFNARSSIIIVTAATFVYFLYNLLFKRVTNFSKSNILIIIVFSVIVIAYFFTIGWGGRLLVEDNLNDSSVEARMLIYNRLLSSDLSMFLIGMSNEQISQWAKMSHIESFWILYLCRFGIFVFLYYVFLFYKLLKYWIRELLFVNKAYIILIFILISSINNSIYSGDPVIVIFILCAATFGDLTDLYKKNNSNKKRYF